MTTNIRTLVDEYIRSTGLARLTTINGEPAVEFLDENDVISLSDLAYDSEMGFHRKSLFATKSTPTASQAAHVIRECDRALATSDPHRLTAAITYGAAWLRSLGYFPDSDTTADSIFARLGEVLGAWYGDVDDERQPTPSVTNLVELCRHVRSKHNEIVRLEAGETGAEL